MESNPLLPKLKGRIPTSALHFAVFLCLAVLSVLPSLLGQAEAAESRPFPSKVKPSLSRTPVAAPQRDLAEVHLKTETGEDAEIHWHDKTGVPRQIRGRKLHRKALTPDSEEERDKQTALAFLRKQRDLLKLKDPDRELKLERSHKDDRGRHYLRFSQVYQGIPVWPREVIVELDEDGDVDLLTGGHVPGLESVIMTPVVNAQVAANLAQKAVSGGATARTSQPVLIVYAPADRVPRLGWKLKVDVSPASRWMVVIDALAGVPLIAQNQVRHANVQISANDILPQTRTLNVWEDASGLRYLVDTSKPMFDQTSEPPEQATTRGGLIVLDAGNQGPTGNFLLNQLSFFFQGPNTARFAEGVSAAFGLSETYDYFLDRHGRNSLDGQGGSITAVVGVGQSFDGAYWNGQAAYFGTAYDYVGALDILAHELTHGVIESSAGLVYVGQSAALTEAFADIFGEMVEARTKGPITPFPPDWLKVVNKPNLLTKTFQNYANPSAVACPTGAPCPAKMSEYVTTAPANTPPSAVDSLLGHTNSSILAHAFYLLAHGLVGTSDIFLLAQARSDAERIFYCTLTTKLVAQAQFTDVRLGAIACARELFGEFSFQKTKTMEAFDAVEVFDAAPSDDIPPAPPVSGPDSTLFTSTVGLGTARREAAMGDPPGGTTVFVSPLLSPLSVTGDGSKAVFVDNASICLLNTNANGPQQHDAICNGIGQAFSAAIARDSQRLAYVPLPLPGQLANHIVVATLTGQAQQEFVVQAPAVEGGSSLAINSIGALAFTGDGRELIFEALTSVQFESATPVALWALYTLKLTTGLVTVLVPPTPGVDHRFPALSQTTDQYVTFESQSLAQSTAQIMVLNRLTGEKSVVAVPEVTSGLYRPVYTGDDGAIVYTVPSLGCRRQPLSGFTTAAGLSEDWLPNAASCVIYRRGPYTPPQFATLTVQKAGQGGGFVSANPGILCGTDCTEEYRAGTTVTLIASATANSHFAGWSGALDCADGVVYVTAATTCIATFNVGPAPPTTATLTVTKAGAGNLRIISQPSGLDCGTVCSGTFPISTHVTLTVVQPNGSGAAPIVNPNFLGWSGDADCSDGQVTLSTARNCVATFGYPVGTPLATLTVTISQGSGTVTSFPYGIVCTSPAPSSGNLCQGTFAQGSFVLLHPTAAPGFAADSCVAGTATCSIFIGTTQVAQPISFPPSPNSLSGDEPTSPITIASDPFLDRRVTSLYTPGGFGDNCAFNAAANAPTVFYRLTPSRTTTVVFSTIGSNYDTVVSVFRLDAFGAPSIACNDNTPEDPTNTTSKVEVEVSAGGTYLIQIVSKSLFPQSDVLNFSYRSMPGEQPGAPIVIEAVPFSDTRSTVDYVPNAFNPPLFPLTEPQDSCAFYPGNTVYYRFTPNEPGTAIITTKGSDYDTVLSVREADPVPFGKEVSNGCNDDAGTTAPFDVTSKVVVKLRAGTAYLIKVASFYRESSLNPFNSVGGTLAFTLTYFPNTGTPIPLTITRVGNGTGTVSGTGIACGTDCVESYVQGSLVTLTATANPGSTFTGWQGGGCLGIAVCIVPMDSAQTVTATFVAGTPASYTLTVIPVGTNFAIGGFSIDGTLGCPSSCTKILAPGAIATVQKPIGYPNVVRYEGCDVVTSPSQLSSIGGADCQVTMRGDRTVTAHIEVAPSLLILRLRPGAPGRVTSPELGFECVTEFCAFAPLFGGQSVSLNALPTGPSDMVDWLGCNFNQQSPLTCYLADLYGKRTVVVGLRQNNLPVFITKHFDPSGVLNQTTLQSDPPAISCGMVCSAIFPAGATVAFTPSNAVFQDLGIECFSPSTCRLHLELVGLGSPQGFIPGRPNNQEVPATMSMQPHTLEIRRMGTGTGIVTSDPAGAYCQEPVCSAQFNDGNLFTLDAVPSPGSVFAGWIGCDAVSGDQNRTCVVPMTSGRIVTASFNAPQHILTVTKTGGGAGVVTSEPAGFSCAVGNCAANVGSGATLRLKAQASGGSVFNSWSGCDAIADGDCLITMSTPRTVTATFTRALPVKKPKPARTPPPPRQ